jgi:hypothetical protein
MEISSQGGHGSSVDAVIVPTSIWDVATGRPTTTAAP